MLTPTQKTGCVVVISLKKLVSYAAEISVMVSFSLDESNFVNFPFAKTLREMIMPE
ncbi:MAG: hypothetical protein ACETVT_05520 [bacterium]